MPHFQTKQMKEKLICLLLLQNVWFVRRRHKIDLAPPPLTSNVVFVFCNSLNAVAASKLFTVLALQLSRRYDCHTIRKHRRKSLKKVEKHYTFMKFVDLQSVGVKILHLNKKKKPLFLSIFLWCPLATPWTPPPRPSWSLMDVKR